MLKVILILTLCALCNAKTTFWTVLGYTASATTIVVNIKTIKQKTIKVVKVTGGAVKKVVVGK